MMRPGPPRYPRGLDDLWGVRVAVDDGSINHLLLAALPEARRPTLPVAATRDGAMMAITIRDHGPGIAAHKVNVIFEPFTLTIPLA